MSFMKKLLVILLSVTCIIACVFGITACNNDNSNNNNISGDNSGNNSEDNDNTGITGGHTFAEGWTGDNDYHWHAATDGSDAVDGKALHEWAIDEGKSSAATCASAGSKVYKCSVCGAEKVEAVSQLSHNWGEVKTNAATCTTAGLEYKECLNDGCDAVTTVKVLPALGHQPEGEATCTTAVNCSVCGKLVEPAKGHNYVLTGSTSATCTETGHANYECYGCGDGYEIQTETAKGHAVVWNADKDNRKYIGTADACYVVLGMCAVCGEVVESENPVTHHVYKGTITAYANCVTDGEKTYTCDCGYSYTESYADTDAHNWGAPVTNGKVATYTCSHNTAHTKSAVVYDDKTADVSVKDLTAAGSVTLAGTSIALDEGVKNTISGKDTVKLSAETLSAEELPLGDASEYVNGPVYNLTLNVDGNNVSALGGTVTVTIPYVLDEGDDPDNIVIWYINGSELEEVHGKYSKGYVIFQTTHFSYYTVTRMTPAQRCAMYGHVYETVEEAPTCLLAGYTMEFCTRCGKHEKTDIPALGHDWNEKLTPATCTENGKAEYKCNTCGVEYEVVIISEGHSWTAVEYVAATCENAGYAKYKCASCGETYEVTLAQKSHSFKSTVIAATCTEGGYTFNKCIVCGIEINTDHTDALGHSLATRTVAPTCTVQGFTLTYCAVCNEEISKDNIKEATGHNTVNGVCTVCGEGCNHSYVAGNTVAATCDEGGYTLYTCSNCNNSYKGDIKAALGHSYDVDECSRCHKLNPEAADYYLNLIKTSLEGSFVIKLSGVTYSQYEEKITISGGNTTSEKVEEAVIEQLELVEIAIALSENGTIIGSGKGKIKVSASNETLTYDCKLAIKDETLYIIEDSDNQSLVPSLYIEVSADYLTYIVSTGDLDFAKIKEYLIWYNSDVKTAIDKLLNSYGEQAAQLIKFALNYLFERTSTADGFTYALNFDKISELNEIMYTVTVKEFADKILGKGVYDGLPETVDTLIRLTPEQAITILGNLGLDKSEICFIIDTAVYIYTGEAISSEQMLDEMLEQGMKDQTVADFIIAYSGLDVTTEEFIAELNEVVPEYLNHYRDLTIYQIIGEVERVDVEEIYGIVNQAIEQYLPILKDSAQLSFTTDKTGNITTAKIFADIDDLLVGGGSYGNNGYIESRYEFDGEREYYIYYYKGTPFAIEVDKQYFDMEGNAYDNLDEIIATLDIERYEYKYYISVNGTAEFVFGGEVKVDESVINAVKSAQLKLEPNSIFTAYEYKDYNYDKEYNNFFTYERGEELRIHTDANGKIIKIVETTEERQRSIYDVTGMYIYCTEWLHTYVYEYDFTSGGMMIVSKDYCKDTNVYALQGVYTSLRTEQRSTLIVHKDTGFIISDVIDNKWVDNYSGTSGTTFYYNSVKNEFYNNDPHSLNNLTLNETKSKVECGGYYYYECEDCGYSETRSINHLGDYDHNIVYELVRGEGSSCTDGVWEKRVCPVCNETVHTYTYYSHQTHLTRSIDLTEYGSVCKHTINVYGCVCGKSEYTGRYYGRYGDLGDKWDSITYNSYSYYYTYNGERMYVTLYTCFVTDCNFKFAYFSTYDKDEHCLSDCIEHWLLGVTVNEETRTVSGGTEITLSRPDGYNHKNGTEIVETANGYIETYKCLDCGLITKVEEYSSVYDSVVTDRLISRTEITTYYKNNVNDNTVSSVTKDEYTYEYNADGQTLKETRITTKYDGAMSEENIKRREKNEYISTYNTDGSKAKYKIIYTYYNGDVVSNIDTTEYIFVQGYQIRTLELTEKYDVDGTVNYWHKYEYIYRDGKYCSPTVLESTSYGESEEREGWIEHRTSGEYLTRPTCTQHGTRVCVFCGEIAQSVRPHGHYYHNGVCEYCGLENLTQHDGRVTFEDMSYTSETEYVIGYCNNETDYYQIHVSLVYTDKDGNEENRILNGLDITDEATYKYYGSGKISFAISDIEKFAAEYEIKNYMIRVTFVPADYFSELDYSITIDVHNWVQGTLVLGAIEDNDGNWVEYSVTGYYCPECRFIKEYGYFNSRYGYYDAESKLYVYEGTLYSTDYSQSCELKTSTPINGIHVDGLED